MTRILFDIARIFIRGSRFSPTGIDRVVVAYARWLLDQPDIELQPVLTVSGRLLGVPRRMLERTIRQNEAFGRLRNDSDEPGPAWGALQAALGFPSDRAAPLRARPVAHQLPQRAKWHLNIAARALANLRPAPTNPGDIYLNVSHTGLGQPRVLARLAERGVAPVVMVHDLIPINFPEYCAPTAEARHQPAHGRNHRPCAAGNHQLADYRKRAGRLCRQPGPQGADQRSGAARDRNRVLQ